MSLDLGYAGDARYSIKGIGIQYLWSLLCVSMEGNKGGNTEYMLSSFS